MPICDIPLTEHAERTEALLKERHGEGPYTQGQRELAAEEIGYAMQDEHSKNNTHLRLK